MVISLSNKYFLEALKAYPYNLAETMESLAYALSYDSNHAGAHCLSGQINMEYLKQFETAEYHFEQALISDMNYVTTYEYYSLLLISTKDYVRALKIIKHAYGIKGINIAIMQYREALLYEHQGKLDIAKTLMKTAFKNSCNGDERNFIKKELDRIKSKLNASKIEVAKQRVSEK